MQAPRDPRPVQVREETSCFSKTEHGEEAQTVDKTYILTTANADVKRAASTAICHPVPHSTLIMVTSLLTSLTWEQSCRHGRLPPTPTRHAPKPKSQKSSTLRAAGPVPLLPVKVHTVEVVLLQYAAQGLTPEANRSDHGPHSEIRPWQSKPRFA